MHSNPLEKLIPDYAGDILENFKKIFTEQQEGLSEIQVAGIAIATCLVKKNEKLLNIIKFNNKFLIDEQEMNGLKSAVAIMLQNNIYYRYFGEIDIEEVKVLPSDLYMTVISSPPIDQVNFEIYMLATSIVNGCKYCCSVHSKKLMKKGVEAIALRNIAKIVAIVAGVSDIMEIERIRNYDFLLREQNL